MKRILLIFAFTFLAVSLQAQNDTLSRDRSRYASNHFREDDKYTMYSPYATVSVKQPRSRRVKNIILMIGDGMGLEQVSAAWVCNGGHLNMVDNCLYTGIQRTYAANKLVTDSGAAGSALATGKKTEYNHLSTQHDGTPNQSLLEYAQTKGKKTGLAVTCRINDATPAVFCSHVVSRDSQEVIVSQMAAAGVDFLSGGGIKYWVNRSDGRNIVEEAKARGYVFADTREGLARAERLPFLGLFAPTEMPPALDRGPILEESAMKALELLDGGKGFFLMIEGSTIDDYGHENKAGYVMEEVFDFDRTVGKVLEWAEKDGHTLVIITADHATGGMTLLDGSLEKKEIEVNFSTGGHNGIMVPVFAYGPHAEDFTGSYENADLSNRIRKLIK